MVVGNGIQVFLVENDILRMGVPAAYLFSWERKRQARTRTGRLDFTEEEGAETNRVGDTS